MTGTDKHMTPKHQKTNNPVNKWANEMNRELSKEGQMTKNPQRKCKQKLHWYSISPQREWLSSRKQRINAGKHAGKMNHCTLW
jgi:hypothetical protein